MLSPEAVEKLREAVRYSDRGRARYSPGEQWERYVPLPHLMTVIITGPIDPASGLYPALFANSPNNPSWETGDMAIKVKPANPSDTFVVGRRYPARPSHADDVTGSGTDAVYATHVYIGYASGSGSATTNIYIDQLGTGTGSYMGPGTGTGTVPWYNFESSEVTINNTNVNITNSQVNLTNVNQTLVNVTQLFTSSSITFGPNTQLTFNTTLPAVVNQHLQFQLGNNVNFVIGPNAPGNANQFQVNVPFRLGNGLFMPHANVPAFGVNQNPLNLGAIVPNADAPIFRIGVNAPGVQIRGLAPAANAVRAKMLGIVNAGPNKPKWMHRLAGVPANNVATPDGTGYTQSVGELLWLWADGSADEWVMAGHPEGSATGASGINGLGSATYLPVWDTSVHQTFGWVRQVVVGASGYLTIENTNGATTVEQIRTTASWLRMGGSIASPHLALYAAANINALFQLQGSPNPSWTLKYETGPNRTTLDLDSGGADDIAFAVRGTRGVTGTVKPGFTAKGGIITYLGTGEFGTAGGASGGDITAVNVTSPIAGGGPTGAVTISHAASGVTPGNYRRANVVVNATGHVTFAEDGTASAGAGDGTGVFPGNKQDITVVSASNWQINPDAVGTAEIADDAVVTARIKDGNVTLPKLANISGPRVLGRTAATSGAVAEISLGSGIFVDNAIAPNLIDVKRVSPAQLLGRRGGGSPPAGGYSVEAIDVLTTSGLRMKTTSAALQLHTVTLGTGTGLGTSDTLPFCDISATDYPDKKAKVQDIINLVPPGTLDINGLSADTPAALNTFPMYRVAATAGNKKATLQDLFNLFITTYGALFPVWGGRLSMSSTDPEGESSGASTIYPVPFHSDQITLWDGTRWLPYTFSTSNSLTLTGLTAGKNYDVFCRQVSGVPTLDHLVWTDDTNRASVLARFNGKLCKTGDQTRLCLGSFRATSTTQTKDISQFRLLWNMYNQVDFTDISFDTSDAWSYNGNGTFRAMNAGNAAWKHEHLIGYGTYGITARAYLTMNAQYVGAFAYSGITLDRALTSIQSESSNSDWGGFGASKAAVAGYYYWQAIESTNANAFFNAYGDNGAAAAPWNGHSPVNSCMITTGKR